MLNSQKVILHQLIEMLPEKDIYVVQQFIEFLLKKADPLTLALLTAPRDDEPWTEKDELETAKGREDILEGKVIPWEEVKRDLGL